MIRDRDVPFVVGDTTFTGIRELGFSENGAFVISAWTTPPGKPRGSYFTCIPISPRAYRSKHPTNAAFQRPADGPDRLVVYDDHGSRTVIYAPVDVLDALEAECDAQLPRRAITRAPTP